MYKVTCKKDFSQNVPKPYFDNFEEMLYKSSRISKH